MSEPSFFLTSYPVSRQRFRQNLSYICQRWPAAQLKSYSLRDYPDLTIDWISAPALESKQKILLLTTGEHGIEGYTGTAMQEYFMHQYLPFLDPRTTGLLLVHAINPWGMHYWRRTNANNVDLNRNFVWDASQLDPTFNPGYARIDSFINPARPIQNYSRSRLAHRLQLSRYEQRHGGILPFWKIILLGQYFNPQGLHYGGTVVQDETSLMQRFMRQAFLDYDQVLHLDMHTGYGPRTQMSLVNSLYEKQTSAHLARLFDYPLVVAATGDEFYAIRGDMIDYIYLLWQNEFPHKKLFATAFEFGTYGETPQANRDSLKAMIFENRLVFQGLSSMHEKASARWEAVIRENFRQLFAPDAPDWQTKALSDAGRAFTGILKAYGYIV